MPRLTEDQLVGTMVQRYGYPEHVARGIVMNWRDESGLDTGIQERAPISGRGGFGLAQWTGPRRDALERYALAQNKDVSDPDLQLDFFAHENATSEKAAWDRVMAAKTPGEAATSYLTYNERPAAANVASRAAKYGGVAVGDPTTNRTTPWNGPAEVDASRDAMAAAIAAQNKPKSMVNEIGDALAGMQFPKTTFSGTSAIRPMGEAPRADAEAVAPVTPLGGGMDRRQVLAQLMAQLNSGRLFG